MQEYYYPISLLVVILLSYTFFQNNSTFLMILTIGIGIYIVYSHETGHTATEFKDSVIKSINDEAHDFSDKKGIHGYDEDKLEKSVK